MTHVLSPVSVAPMFAGIVESTSSVVGVRDGAGVLHIDIKKPSDFNDIKIGDSVAVDGVCLTVEEIAPESLKMTLGPETLRVTGWTKDRVLNRVFNLERSLRLNDRIHGHLVTGHVDAMSFVTACDWKGAALDLKIAIPDSLRELIWPKGSIAVNGVSLTINQVSDGEFSVGLIPETLKKTNLQLLKVGELVTLEADNVARGLRHMARL